MLRAAPQVNEPDKPSARQKANINQGRGTYASAPTATFTSFHLTPKFALVFEKLYLDQRFPAALKCKSQAPKTQELVANKEGLLQLPIFVWDSYSTLPPKGSEAALSLQNEIQQNEYTKQNTYRDNRDKHTNTHNFFPHKKTHTQIRVKGKRGWSHGDSMHRKAGRIEI